MSTIYYIQPAWYNGVHEILLKSSSYYRTLEEAQHAMRDAAENQLMYCDVRRAFVDTSADGRSVTIRYRSHVCYDAGAGLVQEPVTPALFSWVIKELRPST